MRIMSSSAARENVCSNSAVACELSRLFSPVFYVKKEDLDPFVSLLNGIKYKYWDNADKFHHVIGLLHQLKLDTSTQVLEHQQCIITFFLPKLLIKNRLIYVLRDSPELLGTLLKTISDASNNSRHVLNARPVSVGLQSTKGQQDPILKSCVNLSATRPAPAFVIRNNTVTLPWQPWFAHLVPKVSIAGRTVLRLQPGRVPYSFVVPKSPSSAGSVQRVVTSRGLLTIQPSRPASASSMVANKDSKPTDFGVSRKLYGQTPSSLHSPKAAPNIQNVNAVKESSDISKEALLKKQQEFLRQLALLKTEKANQGCSKQLFPPDKSSVSSTTGKRNLSTNAGDNTTTSTARPTTMRTRSGNATVRVTTRQSAKKNAVGKRRSPRNKQSSAEKMSSSNRQHNVKTEVGEEKGLLLSRVGEHCIVVSIPDQSPGKSSASKSKSGNKTDDASSATKSERKKKHKKKKKHSKSRSEDTCINSPTSAKAFERVKSFTRNVTKHG
ncbi:uncharacterized protein [Amphiura filiformis]|uniref:uncharacterized protein n=1 Tax=Amphiura filiformis TaxID=82378 RepID=UPI003B226B71